MLVDLTAAVAEALNRPFHALSMEMIYRGLYHFTVARHRGKADDPIAYLAADAEGLGIIKRQRKNRGAATALFSLTIHGKPYLVSYGLSQGFRGQVLGRAQQNALRRPKL